MTRVDMLKKLSIENSKESERLTSTRSKGSTSYGTPLQSISEAKRVGDDVAKTHEQKHKQEKIVYRKAYFAIITFQSLK